jgi:hypothetical protein
MSKIVVLAESTDAKRLLPSLRGLTGRPMDQLNEALRSAQPFWEVIIFGNDHDQEANRLRAILREAAVQSVPLRIFELREGESFASCPQSACEISGEVLERILEQFEEARDRM